MNPVPARRLGVAALLPLSLSASMALAPTLAGCRDLSNFSTNGSASYTGAVVQADFVRAGVGRDVNLCLTLDAGHLQDTPGAISTSDGLFASTPLRAIPQIWQDPLSTLTFGEGRTKNLVYVATSHPDGGTAADVMVVLSLMDSGNVEVRLLRGAPTFVPDGGDASGATNLFAIFTLTRQTMPCQF